MTPVLDVYSEQGGIENILFLLKMYVWTNKYIFFLHFWKKMPRVFNIQDQVRNDMMQMLFHFIFGYFQEKGWSPWTVKKYNFQVTPAFEENTLAQYSTNATPPPGSASET